STLNAIESTAATTTTTMAASIPMPTASATEVAAAAKSFSTENRTNTLRWSTTSQEFFSIANSLKAGTVLRAHSISSSTGGGLEAEVKAKSSITASTKDVGLKDGAVTQSSGKNAVGEAEVAIAIADYNFATEISTTQITKTLEKASQSELKEATVTSATAGKAFSGSSTQSTRKVDVTTKRTKVSLSRLVTVDKENGQQAAGERGERGERRENGGSPGDPMVAESTTAVTPVAVVTTRIAPISKTEANLASTISRATTIESLSAAAASQLVATLFPIRTISDESSKQQKYQNASGSVRAYSQVDIHNSKHNYNYDYNKMLIEARGGKDNNNPDVSAGTKHISSENTQRWPMQQPQTHPLQRPKIQKGDNHTDTDSDTGSDSDSDSSNNSNNFLYNSNNNYFSSHQNAASNILMMQQQQPLRQLRQQYARQVQQQPPFSAIILTPATSSTTSAIAAANDSNLISNVIHYKQTPANTNKSTLMKNRKSTQPMELPSTLSVNSVSLTTVTSKSGSNALAGAASGALGEREPMNGTTTASPFPTVTTNIVKSTTRRPPPTTTPRPTPSIDDYQTVISQAGTHAYLPCN
ncbi:PREDICTED: suppressor protein SRP40-like, partial [Rhagoletis zephyria]|uniref:suppressor protein SRP40-like n=1 Tax=Rhagoletis zephyria TaxID=28612 RepID=UPI000811937B